MTCAASNTSESTVSARLGVVTVRLGGIRMGPTALTNVNLLSVRITPRERDLGITHACLRRNRKQSLLDLNNTTPVAEGKYTASLTPRECDSGCVTAHGLFF